jgi:two-component system LytT family sensor kinase
VATPNIFCSARAKAAGVTSARTLAFWRAEAAVVEQVEQLRGAQMQNLVSQAELKALQAEINPHFLFNSLNTLYGTIDRSNAEARRLVLNLSDVFRYLLRSDRTFIEIDEELKIVRGLPGD